VADLLKGQYDIKSVLVRSKPNFSKPAPEELVEEVVKNVDVIITGVGD
jgi:hypothetical protein